MSIKVQKRDGKLVDFNAQNIYKCFDEAFWTSGSFDESLPRELADCFIDELFKNLLSDYLDSKDEGEEVEESPEIVLTIDEMQNHIEKFLMANGYYDVAIAYIEYAFEKNTDRNYVKRQQAFINKYRQSDNNANATIDDNSNVNTHNIATLNTEIHKSDNVKVSRGMIVDELRELYPDFDAKNYLRDLNSHIIYKHDESSFAGAIAPYCCAVSMYPFLLHGIEKLGGHSAKPENLDSFCGIYTNLVHALSGQFAGAVATPEFLMYFDYFARKRWGNEYAKHLDDPDGYFCRYDESEPQYNDKTDEITINGNNIPTHISSPTEDMDYHFTWWERIKAFIFGKLKLSKWRRVDVKPVGTPISIRKKIYQKFQQVVYTINQPAGCRGNQSAFVNFSYFDEGFFHAMFDEFVFPDGSKPIWESLNTLQKVFIKWFNAERERTILTFPVESFALIYKDGKFEDEENAKFVAEMYSEGHSFFTYLSNTADSLSSCCRLKNKVQTKEFSFTNGNIGVQTGSKSVITLNLNRITQDAMKEYRTTSQEISSLEYLNNYINNILERVYKYHTAYNSILKKMQKDGLLNAYSAGFINLDKQYLTIGLNGLNEAAEFMGCEISNNNKYAEFCRSVFGNIKAQNAAHKTKELSFNTECVPAESLAAKNYNWDKADGYWVPSNHNLYASYIFRPSDDSLNIIDKIKMHGDNFIGDYLDGGSAAHLNLNEHLSFDQYWSLLHTAGRTGCQYLTFNIPNSKCTKCGHITKHPIDKCPKCGSTEIDYYDRIIGYMTKVKNWHASRYKEWFTRYFATKESVKTD